MALWIRGMSLNELRALTQAMRFSGEVIGPFSFGKKAVDKHSTGGVGDKTSLLLAPIARLPAARRAHDQRPRAWPHRRHARQTRSIPGFRTLQSLDEFRSDCIDRPAPLMWPDRRNLLPPTRCFTPCAIVTATVESANLICASIMSKKLAEGIDGLVLDVKTGSGAFMKRRKTRVPSLRR